MNVVNLETNISEIIKDPEIFLHVCVMYIRYMNECSTHTEKSDYLSGCTGKIIICTGVESESDNFLIHFISISIYQRYI